MAKTRRETGKLLYLSREGEEDALFGVCHLSEQKCISTKIGMGAGLEIDWETNNAYLCTSAQTNDKHQAKRASPSPSLDKYRSFPVSLRLFAI